MPPKGVRWAMKWYGDQLANNVETDLAEAWIDVGLTCEKNAKAELRKGHGVVTGTLRRSIHIEQPGYNWSGDDVTPQPGTPERGSKRIAPKRSGSKVTLLIGSGMNYAMGIEIGFGSFTGYHYLRNGWNKTKGQVLDIIKRRIQRKYGKKKK